MHFAFINSLCVVFTLKKKGLVRGSFNMITKILSFGLLTFMIANASPMPKGFPQYLNDNSIIPEIAIPQRKAEQRVYYFEETTEMNEKGRDYVVENLNDLEPMTNNLLSNGASRKREINPDEEFEIVDKPRKPRMNSPDLNKRSDATPVEDSEYGIKDGPTGYDSVSKEDEYSGRSKDFYKHNFDIDEKRQRSYYPNEIPGINVQSDPRWIPGQLSNSANKPISPEGDGLLNVQVQYGDPTMDRYGKRGLMTGTGNNVLHNGPYLGKNGFNPYPGQIRHPIDGLVSTGMIVPNYVANTGHKLLNLF